MMSLSDYFYVVLVLLSSLVTGPSFMSSSGVMTISFYEGLTRNPKIGNTPVRILLNN